MPINLTILGSGSAVPILGRGVTSQHLNINERRILIDCGEGTQLQLRRFKVKFQRIQFIFISHLHGDHFLGLFGLVSSMSLLGRTKNLRIFGPEGLEEIVRHQFKLSQVYLSYELEFEVIDCKEKALVFEDNSIEIYAFPLKHRVKCHGFLFQEKPRPPKMNKDKIKEYSLTLEEILAARKGEDIIRETGTLLNNEVTHGIEKCLSYAYCTDTRFVAKLPKWIEGASLLYHEATFTKAHTDRAKATGHSTAEDAATIAKEANVEQLILGHFSTRYKDTEGLLDEAKAVFKNVKCVEDGDVYLV
ncbi:MAG: ribonuclease Z [Crocinitomix sp.]|nr:ribonuclease Z [Crocinitomix sp.]